MKGSKNHSNADLKDIQNEFETINIDDLNNEISDTKTSSTDLSEKNASNDFKIIDLDNDNNDNNDEMI